MLGAGNGPFRGCKTGFYLLFSKEESICSPFPPTAAPRGFPPPTPLQIKDEEMT